MTRRWRKYRPEPGNARRVAEAAKLRARRLALGLGAETLAGMMKWDIDELEAAEAGWTVRMHYSDRFKIAAVLQALEERARADLDGYLAEHPSADRDALLVVHPAPRLVQDDLAGFRGRQLRIGYAGSPGGHECGRTAGT